MTRFLAVTPYNGCSEEIINVSEIERISVYPTRDDEISEITFKSGKSLMVKEKYNALRFVLVATEDLRALAK